MTNAGKIKEDEQLFIRYLLGTLPEAERDELEARYFRDPALLELLLVTENQLIEDYTDGRLSADERRNFEQNYLQTPEKRYRVSLVSRLRRSASELTGETHASHDYRKQSGASWWQQVLAFFSPQNPTARLAMGFASLAVIFGGVWLAYQNQNLRSRIRWQEQAEATLKEEKQELERQLAGKSSQHEELARELRETEVARGELEEQLSEQLAVDHQQAGKPPVIPSIELGGRGVSGAEVGTASSGQGRAVSVRLPPAAKFIQVRVPINRPGYRSYILSLRDLSDNESWRRNELIPRSLGARQVIRILIPTSAVKSGKYTFVLLGQTKQGPTEFIAEYPIKVEVR